MRLSAFPIVCLCFFLSIFAPAVLFGQTYSSVVIWSEPELPVADSPAPSAAQLTQAFPEARLASTEQLSAQLDEPHTRLLILPQGSIVPEAAWSVIFAYLQRGGNLLVLGGRPFTRACYHDSSGWHLRDYSVRFSRLLLIDQYQAAPNSLPILIFPSIFLSFPGNKPTAPSSASVPATSIIVVAPPVLSMCVWIHSFGGLRRIVVFPRR